MRLAAARQPAFFICLSASPGQRRTDQGRLGDSSKRSLSLCPRQRTVTPSLPVSSPVTMPRRNGGLPTVDEAKASVNGGRRPEAPCPVVKGELTDQRLQQFVSSTARATFTCRLCSTAQSRSVRRLAAAPPRARAIWRVRERSPNATRPPRESPKA